MWAVPCAAAGGLACVALVICDEANVGLLEGRHTLQGVGCLPLTAVEQRM
jgi:hypothetical protein